MKNKALLAIVAAALLALGFNYDQIGDQIGELLEQQPVSAPTVAQPSGATSIPSPRTAGDRSTVDVREKWSKTTPKVNLHHVFHGEINRKGRPVGYHSRPNGRDPAGARLVRIKSKANRVGVYTATIAVRDGSRWKEKFSSFFPDKMNRNEVVNAILRAYKNSRDRNSQPWRGPSGRGFDIQGYTLSRGGINTAFPVYERN